MAKRTAYVLMAVLLVAGTAIFGYQVLRGGSAPQSSGVSDRQPVAGTGPARVLLNELVFQPPSGEPQWVELLNAGGESGALAGMVLENQAGEKFPLPVQLTLPPGGVLLVRFDGQANTDANTVHASPTTFLAASGFILLTAQQGQIDRIAWGDNQARAASLSRGGDQEELTPGTSLGRVPGLTASDPLEWVPYSPQQTTPGRSNPQPGVEILLPMDGAIVTAGARELSWYPVAGAARYRVQLATDPSFASIVLDQTVDLPPLRAPALAPGSYVWRVQVIGRDETTEYSAASTITVRAARSTPGPGRVMLDWLMPALHAQAPQSSNIDDELPIVLDVPMIKQHKDTGMLLLESRRESAGKFGHTWDADHEDLGEWDHADNRNCATASIAMLTAFYGGRLSQDRINYEVFKDDAPGPQGDLNFGGGYSDDRKKRALEYALGREPTREVHTDDSFLAAVILGRIDKRIPMMACKNRHCVAIVGAGLKLEIVVVNDPWIGTYIMPIRNLLGARIFVMSDRDVAVRWPVRGRSDEPDVSRDSDGDGVVDFDEIHRFHTNPRLEDHDGDELPDKEDIKASVHDRRHGFAYGGNGRDFDSDGTMMELDNDSDNGGCLDGWEDANKNGKFEQSPGESDNFFKDDDPCLRGEFKKIIDDVYVPPDEPPGARMEYHEKQLSTFSLKPEPDGTLKGRGHASWGFETLRIMPTRGNCKMTTAVAPATWTVELTGQSKALPDGSLEVTLQARPAQGPSVPVQTRDECPHGFSLTQTMPAVFSLPPGPYKLVNRVYRLAGETPHPAGHTGRSWWEFTLKLNEAAGR